MMPFQIVSIWFRGLLSIALLILGPYLVYRWYEESHVNRVQPTTRNVATTTPSTFSAMDSAPSETTNVSTREFSPEWGLNRPTALLTIGALMFLWAVPKGPSLNLTRWLRRPGTDEPHQERTGEVHQVSRPDGSQLRVESYGPPNGPPIVLTHGWGLDSAEWYYARKELAGYRLIVWDLPGLGLSREPANHDYSLENLARDLDAVVGVAGGRPVVLLGHSIGGMISLTYCKLFPEAMSSKIRGLVLVNTTYTNPVKTTSMAALKTALQKPVFEPLLHLTIWLSPLVRVMNWLSYWNGSAHKSNERSGYSGHETRGQLDFIAGYTPRTSPAVIARGMLGMLHYDATDTLRTITVPTLVITGDKDSVCLPEASHRMQADIRGAQLITLTPAKHEGLIEHHEKFAAAVAAHLERC